MKKVRIAGKTIGEGYPVFVIAEAGCNHNGNIAMAKRLVDAASEAEADAVKFQTFTSSALVIPHAAKADYQKKNSGSPDETQYALLKKLELPFHSFTTLKAYCKEKGIIFLSTPFDNGSADLLDQLHVPAFKIASGEITNFPFLSHIARKKKPIILSTGMSTLEEVEKAVALLNQSGGAELILLHCTSDYPAPPEDVNLRAMNTLHRRFRVPAGLSDHTPGGAVALAAVALGASVIEKHLTLDKGLPGPDHRASLEPHELKLLVEDIRSVEKALGDGIKKPSPAEIRTRFFARKSIVTATPIKKGQLLTERNLTVKRPGTGISPTEWETVLGRKAVRDFEKDELLEIDQTACIRRTPQG